MRPKLGPENNNNNVSPILFSKFIFEPSGVTLQCRIGNTEELLENEKFVLSFVKYCMRRIKICFKISEQ